jgi:hypothetical protein
VVEILTVAAPGPGLRREWELVTNPVRGPSMWPEAGNFGGFECKDFDGVGLPVDVGL